MVLPALDYFYHRKFVGLLVNVDIDRRIIGMNTVRTEEKNECKKKITSITHPVLILFPSDKDKDPVLGEK